MEDKVLVAALLFWIVFMEWSASEGVNTYDVCQGKCNVTVDSRKRITTNVRQLLRHLWEAFCDNQQKHRKP